MDVKHSGLHFRLVKHSGNDLNAILPAAIEICPSEGRSFYHVMKPSHRDIEIAEFICLAANSYYPDKALIAELVNCCGEALKALGECTRYTAFQAETYEKIFAIRAKAEGDLTHRSAIDDVKGGTL